MLPCHNTCKEYRHEMCKKYYIIRGCQHFMPCCSHRCNKLLLTWSKVRKWAAKRERTIEKCEHCEKGRQGMVPSEPSDKVRMQLTVNVKEDGTVVLPVAQEIEYFAGITGQDYHRVQFDPIPFGKDCNLKYDKKLGGWRLEVQHLIATAG